MEFYHLLDEEKSILDALRSLTDHLDAGIIIFHGETPDELTPIFCNEGCLRLSGLNAEEFRALLEKDNYYGVYAADIAETRKKFIEAFYGNRRIRHYLRVRKPNQNYEWVSMHARIVFLEKGGFDVYMILADAEDAEQLNHIRENRRRQRQKRQLRTTESEIAYALLNLTQNICEERFYTHEPVHAVEEPSSAELLLKEIADDIAIADSREKFIRQFSISTLQNDMNEGILTKQMRLPFCRAGRSAQWYLLNSELSFHPDTNELEAFLTFADIDNEVRLGYIIDRLLDSEYELICQIDTQNGYVTKYGRNDDGYFGEGRHEGGDYRTIVNHALEQILPPAYWEEGKDSFSLERVLFELSVKENYSITFPVIADRRKEARICRWRFEYVDDTKSTILLIRTNVSDILNYGYDSLTGMFDRHGFCKRVRETLDKNLDRSYRLIEIDFDNFKLVNETYSYSEGNRFLRKFGAELRQKASLFGDGCTIGHLEGEHFLIFIPRDVEKEPEEIYEEIDLQVRSYHDICTLKLRMGVYEILDPSLDVTIMCDCVQLALRACKGSFNRNITYFTPDLKDEMLEQQMLAFEMQGALDTKQFEVWFQPQVNHARGGTLIGAEALVRWIHPTRGMLSPAVFVPMFEQNGFIYEMDKYVWRRTCQYIRHWLDEGLTPLPISVNVSRLDIVQSDFLETIIGIVNEERVPYDLFHIEITESAFTDNAGRVVEIVKELVQHGFTVAIDDFGSGYSSLSLLKSVQAHILKLDMRFFADKDDAARNECIVESIIRMAKMLGMAVLAEGVEHVEQANLLQTIGCDYVQGYLYSKPLPHDDYTEYEKRGKTEQKLSSNARREETEEEAMQSQELFRKIISGTNDVIVVADLGSKRLLYANHAAERFYKKSFDPMTTMTCCEYCNNCEECANCPAQELSVGEKKELVFSKNGSHMRAQFSRMEWNGQDAFVFYQTDISAELREMEFADSLIRNIPAALVTMVEAENGEGSLSYISEQAHEIFAKAGILENTPDTDVYLKVVHPEDRQRIEAAWKATLTQKCNYHEEFRIMCLDGGILWLDYAINPVKDNNGHYMFYGIFTDITERKLAQS